MDRDGYGVVRSPWQASDRAHRVAVHLVYGSIPDGLVAMHLCDNPPCCNPAHLRIASVAENNADRAAKGRNGAFRRSENERRAQCPVTQGERNPGAKLTTEIVRAIRVDQRRQITIAKDLGVSPSLISAVKRRVIWRHIH